tara:strand:- start:444 stop:1616 length:1173 start_codon:yes stop_codon:yes gene_type:complete
MSVKVYNKRGKLNYREAKIVKDIQAALEKKYANNPEALKNFMPANNLEELKKLQIEYSITDVDYEEIPTNDIEENHKKFRDSMKETIEPKVENNEIASDNLDDNGFIDPFNDAAPIVRDYVLENNLQQKNDDNSSSSFDSEPTTFKDAFAMPDDNTPNSSNGGGGNNNNTKQTKQEPLNPSYNSQSSGRKKRTNKKFAKYIVEAVCMLAERGFIWWTTNEITEQKVVEYELSGEMDLSLLLTMPNGQEGTVKEWFRMQCLQAEQLAKFDKEEKEDLAEILAEVLDKKGVSPTEEQEALIIAASMFGKKFLIGYDMKRGISSILTQLRDMQKGQPPIQRQYEEKGYDEPEAVKNQQEEEAQIITETDPFKNTIVEDIEGNFAGMTDLQITE